jgi:hypothetical protein
MYAVKAFSDFNKQHGIELFLLSQYLDLNLFDSQIRISECDKALIKLHLEKQRQALRLAGLK